MDRNEENRMLDEIDRFLNYEMTPEEESDFIARMEKDEVLREQVFLRQLVVEAERKKAEARILYQKKPERKKLSVRVQVRWVAACLCVLMVLGYFYGRMYRFSTQDVLHEVYNPPVWETLRSEGFSTPETARINRHIEEWYSEGKSDSLVLYYQQLSEENKLACITEKSKMYLGIAFLRQDNIGQAYVLAEELQKSVNKEVGDWLMLGCLLHDGKREEAVDWALYISQQKNSYSEEALQIYDALNQRRWF